MVRRWLGTILRGLGITAFSIGLWIGILILLEGITGLVGEGERLKTESTDQIRTRLIAVGVCWGVAALGWVLARVGTAIRDPGSRPPVGAARLTAEVLWLAGGLGLMSFGLGSCTPRAATYETPEEYRRWMTGGLVAGIGLPAVGWGIHRLLVARRSGRRDRPPSTDR